MGWPGLGEESSEICKELKLPDLNEVDMPTTDIKAAIKHHHWKFVRDKMESSKKLQDIVADDFAKPQSYFNDKCIENGRMAFKIRSKMIKEIPANFKNNYNEEDQVCKFCQENKLLNQSHCVVCPAWEKQREGLDLTNIDDMVTFFREMLSEMKRKKKGPPGLQGTTPDTVQ